MLILFFSVRLGWLPASGFVPIWESPLANLQRMLMPAFVLGTALAAVLMRQTRNSMIEVMSADYIRTAYSKGLAGRAVVFRHAVRNGLIPVVTILGLQMGALISGAVVTEQIFVVPGFGRLIVEAVFTRDYPLVQGVVLVTASAYVLINLLVDVSYSLLNPRIRIKGAGLTLFVALSLISSCGRKASSDGKESPEAGPKPQSDQPQAADNLHQPEANTIEMVR